MILGATEEDFGYSKFTAGVIIVDKYTKIRCYILSRIITVSST